MTNTVFSLAVVVTIFLAISGSVLLIGRDSLDSNNNLETDVIAEISGYDTEIYTDFQINATTGDLSAIKADKQTGGIIGADPEDREFLQSKKDLANVEVSYRDVDKIPTALITNSKYVEINDTKLFLGLIGSIIALSIFLAGYKFVRSIKVDKNS